MGYKLELIKQAPQERDLFCFDTLTIHILNSFKCQSMVQLIVVH